MQHWTELVMVAHFASHPFEEMISTTIPFSRRRIVKRERCPNEVKPKLSKTRLRLISELVNFIVLERYDNTCNKTIT